MNPNSIFQYVTLNGVVIHGSKLNGMLWGITGRALGFAETELLLFASLAEYTQSGGPDSESASNAILLGFEVYEMHESNPHPALIESILRREKVLELQDPDLYDHRLWPSLYMFSDSVERPRF